MRPKTYPQEPLAKLRATKVDAATSALAKAVRSREQADRVERSNRKVGEDAEARVKATRDAERSALESGELRAADLERAEAWGARVEGDLAEIERRVANASSRAQAARDAEGVARDGVANARVDEVVVERDRARWEDGERKRAEAKEEEAASEAWRKPT
jgi:hypothetical protein